jgi:hypothetical protein
MDSINMTQRVMMDLMKAILVFSLFIGACELEVVFVLQI